MAEKSPMVENIELREELKAREREIANLKGQLAKANGDLSSANDKLKLAELHIDIADAARKVGVIPGAVIDVTSRAARSGEWKRDKDGKFRMVDKDGFPHDDIYEFLRKVKADVPFYFEDSALTEELGGPANVTNIKTAGGANGVETDPKLLRMFAKETMNLTDACKFAQSNPERAARIAEQVGNKTLMNIFKSAKQGSGQ